MFHFKFGEMLCKCTVLWLLSYKSCGSFAVCSILFLYWSWSDIEATKEPRSIWNRASGGNWHIWLNYGIKDGNQCSASKSGFWTFLDVLWAVFAWMWNHCVSKSTGYCLCLNFHLEKSNLQTDPWLGLDSWIIDPAHFRSRAISFLLLVHVECY